MKKKNTRKSGDIPLIIKCLYIFTSFFFTDQHLNQNDPSYPFELKKKSIKMHVHPSAAEAPAETLNERTSLIDARARGWIVSYNRKGCGALCA